MIGGWTIAQSAANALSLKRDTVFRLLVIMTALLGWIAGLFAGGLMGLENVYNQWQLHQQSHISVYLMADSDEQEVMALAKELNQIKGVQNVSRLSRSETIALLEPYFNDDTRLPVPVVLDARVKPNFNRSLFDKRVQRRFPTAEIDDARGMLSSIAKGVRLAQGTVIALALVVFTIMTVVVSLTVRAGLRGQKESLSIMQYVGATDNFLASLITRQVLGRSFIGWVIACGLACISLLLAVGGWHSLIPYFDHKVWLSAIGAPLLLLAASVLTAWWTARSVIRRSV